MEANERSPGDPPTRRMLASADVDINEQRGTNLVSGDGFIDPQALERSLDALRERIVETSLPGALRDAIETTQSLFSATGAGVMMVDESTVLGAVAATDEPARILEERQERIGRGPCVDALTFDRIVLTEDLETDERWPELSGDLSALGVHAVLGVPIRVGGLPVGSLNVYRNEASHWSQSEIAALTAYGGLIDGMLLTSLRAQANEQLVTQLQQALDNRVVIERAVGVIMARERSDAVTAFGYLRKEARNTRRKASEVAAELLSEITTHGDSASSDPVR